MFLKRKKKFVAIALLGLISFVFVPEIFESQERQLFREAKEFVKTANIDEGSEMIYFLLNSGEDFDIKLGLYSLQFFSVKFGKKNHREKYFLCIGELVGLLNDSETWIRKGTISRKNYESLRKEIRRGSLCILFKIYPNPSFIRPESVCPNGCESHVNGLYQRYFQK